MLKKYVLVSTSPSCSYLIQKYFCSCAQSNDCKLFSPSWKNIDLSPDLTRVISLSSPCTNSRILRKSTSSSCIHTVFSGVVRMEYATSAVTDASGPKEIRKPSN